MAEGIQGGRSGGARAEAQGEAERLRLPGQGDDARAGARAEGPEARGRERLLKKIDSPEGREALPNREKAVVVSGLSGQYPLVDLLECAGLARSSYYYALSHPKAPTRPELWEAAAEIFSRTANGCGHRQIAGWCSRLEKAGVVQSMSRKGNCIDNGATEQVFGHMKDELFRGREWLCFEDFKRDLDEYVVHWNTRRRQVKLKGLTPEEFRNQSLCAA